MFVGTTLHGIDERADRELVIDPEQAEHCSLTLPWVEPRSFASAESFGATFEGPIAAERNTGRVLLDDPWFVDDDAGFCSRGVQDMALAKEWAAELGVAQASCLHIIASTPNFILANQCLYDWYDEDYIKGGILSFDGPFLTVPKAPGLGVELDRDKMSRYHEKYKAVGTYGLSRMDSEEARTAPPPLFPSY